MEERSERNNRLGNPGYVCLPSDFVTIGLVVVLCLVYGQLAPWSVRPKSTHTFSLVNSILGHFAPLPNPSHLDSRYFSHLFV